MAGSYGKAIFLIAYSHLKNIFDYNYTVVSPVYLILLKLLARQYEEAYRLIEVCAIDTKFTPEETWVFNLIQERAERDSHPNAEAIRLKLILAIMYSNNDMKWETNVIFQRYLKNVAHINCMPVIARRKKRTFL